jgi:hypothetical protein
MKKIIYLVLVLMFILTACGENKNNNVTEQPTDTTSTAAVTTEVTTAAETPKTTLTVTTTKPITATQTITTTEPITATQPITTAEHIATTQPVTTEPITTDNTSSLNSIVITAIDPLWIDSVNFGMDFRYVERYNNHFSRKTIISNSALNEYFENILSLDLLENVTAHPNSVNTDVLLNRYDNDFFENNIIIVFAYSQRQGSKPIIRNLEHSNNEVYITVERPFANAPSQPQVISQGIYFIKIDRQFYNGNNINIKTFTNE